MQSMRQGRGSLEPLFDLKQFQFDLPEELIALKPAAKRDESRLLVVERATGTWRDCYFKDLANLLQPSDHLVVNNTRVLACRLVIERPSGAKREALFLPHVEAETESLADDAATSRWALLAKGLKVGEIVRLGSITGEVLQRLSDGAMEVQWQASKATIEGLFSEQGRMPLPPYILKRRQGAHEVDDKERYQTLYAAVGNSVAAPTAGLHFSHEVLEALRARGIKRHELTLDVGRATFQPIQHNDLRQHQMGREWYNLPAAVAQDLSAARQKSQRVIAVGTTVVRTLESARRLGDLRGWTDLFIFPSQEPAKDIPSIDGLVTNFHLPGSSLLLLTAAFAGKQLLLDAYAHAIAQGYRFYSYGDAMLIV